MQLAGACGLRGAAARHRSSGIAVQRAARTAARRSVAARAEGEGSGAKSSGAPALSEDMIARLRAAEEEAARLKKQLADLQQSQVGRRSWAASARWQVAQEKAAARQWELVHCP
jgi:hypothetical protein